MNIDTQDNLIQDNSEAEEKAIAAEQEPTMEPVRKKVSTKTRVLVGAGVGIVYLAVVLVTILSGGTGGFSRFLFDAFVIAVAIVAGLEMSLAIGNKFSKPMHALVVANIVLGFAVFYVSHFWLSSHIGDTRSGGITAFFFVLAIMFLVCIVHNVFSKNSSMSNVLSTMFAFIYPTMLSVYMLSLNYIRTPDGGYGLANAAVLLMFLIPAFTDTGAYVIGSRLRGPLLAPKISPKKTISGAVGGIICGILASSIVLIFSHFDILNIGVINQNVGLNIMHFIFLGAFGAVFVVIGDLIASYVKRQCGVKDFGAFLPGHGGMLDRVDSMLLNSVFLFIYFYALTLPAFA